MRSSNRSSYRNKRAITAAIEASSATPQSQLFVITRHGHSTNNMADDKNMGSPGDTQIPTYYPDANLSVWGILTALSTDKQTIVSKRQQQEHTIPVISTVYVSCLVRTWITAILKYLPFSDPKKPFLLVISPYLKEMHFNADDFGNNPLNLIRDQFEQLHLFFRDLENIRRQLYGAPISGVFANKLNRILDARRSVRLTFPLLGESSFDLYPTSRRPSGHLRSSLRYDSNISYRVRSSSYSRSRLRPYSLSRSRSTRRDAQGAEYLTKTLHTINKMQKNAKNKNQLFDILGASGSPLTIPFENESPTYLKYYGESSVFLFIHWVRSVMKDQSPVIYAVSHSEVMQSTMINICKRIHKKNNRKTEIKKENLKTCHPNLGTIPQTNMWDIAMEVQSSEATQVQLRDVRIDYGEQRPPSSAIDLSQEFTCRGRRTIAPTETPSLFGNFI